MKSKDGFKRITAQAGTLESSDCLVTCSLQDNLEIEYRGPDTIEILRERTEKLVKETTSRYGLKGAYISIQDNGALEVTMKARLETAVERCLEVANHE